MTFYEVSMVEFNSSTKNTEEEPFGIPNVIIEPYNNLRDKLIIERDTGFLFEINHYYCD